MSDVRLDIVGNKLYMWSYLVGYIMDPLPFEQSTCCICSSKLLHPASQEDDPAVRLKCGHLCSKACLKNLVATDRNSKCPHCYYPICNFAVNPGPDGYDSDGPTDDEIRMGPEDESTEEEDEDMDSNGDPVGEVDVDSDEEEDLPEEKYDSEDGDDDYWALRYGFGFGGGPEGYAKYLARRAAHKARDFPNGYSSDEADNADEEDDEEKGEDDGQDEAYDAENENNEEDEEDEGDDGDDEYDGDENEE